MRKTVAIGLIFLISLFITPSFAQEPLKIGLAAMITPKKAFSYYKDLFDYVGRKTGRDVEMVQRPTYDEMDNLLRTSEVKTAFICSGPYVRDNKEFGVEILVAPVVSGKPFYHAYIITSKNSPYTSLAELEGKSFAFTDPKSNTGKLVPTYMLAKRFKKTPEEFFSSIKYSGSHDRSIEMVAKGLVNGASVDSLIYDYLYKKGSRYVKLTKIIEKSEAYGIPPVVVTKDIDPSLKERLRKVFLNMHNDPEGRRILNGLMIDRFIVPDDRNYDTVRQMEEWLKGFKG